ncbi:MAG: hypothetical protein KJN71_03430 [Acidimicrobiia bacterium]|nr:hypothetical protein [Acidimicrobiia bacterium]
MIPEEQLLTIEADMPLRQWREADVTILPRDNFMLTYAGKNRWMNVRLFAHGVFVDDLEGEKFFPMHMVVAVEDPHDEPSAIESLEEELAQITEEPQLPFEETLDDVVDRT